MVEDWQQDASAILQTFYAGQEGGTALASLLLGEVSPSGKLPFSVAKNLEDYPYFDKDADEITYDLWHGYSKFDRDGIVPRFGFGHGLSYATFAYEGLIATRTDDQLDVAITVTNTSDIEGDEIVFAFVAPPGLAVERPSKLLKAFTRVSLKAGHSKQVHMSIPLASLGWWHEAAHGFENEAGAHMIYVGPSSDLTSCSRTTLEL